MDNINLDRHSRLACGLDVEPEADFAERMLHFSVLVARGGDVVTDDVDLDAFLDRTTALRSIVGGAQ